MPSNPPVHHTRSPKLSQRQARFVEECTTNGQKAVQAATLAEIDATVGPDGKVTLGWER